MDDKKEPPPKEVSSATSAAKAATDQVERALGEAEEAVQRAAGRAWSQAGDMADDVLAAGRRAAQAGSHQINEQPLMAVIGSFALGYGAAFLLHGRR